MKNAFAIVAFTFVVSAVLFCGAGIASAGRSDEHAIATPEGVTWNQNSAVLSGDPRKEGAPFSARLKFADDASGPQAAAPAAKEPRVKLNFAPEAEKLAAATEEYRRIWQEEGTRMLDAMELVSGMKYDETEVNVIVYEGPSSSGYKGSPMKMRASYSPDIKKATLIHELGHRCLSRLRNRPKDIDEHRLLFLWLYDVWVKLYGREFADNAVKVESARKGLYDYESAWKWAVPRQNSVHLYFQQLPPSFFQSMFPGYSLRDF